MLRDETELIALCVALGASESGGPLTADERALVKSARSRIPLDESLLDKFSQAILDGEDPLGDEFCTLRSPEERRPTGSFYTPKRIVESMVTWVLERDPARIVDAGAGSGRFAVATRRMGFAGELIAIDADPLASLMTRAHLAVAGFRDVRVVQGDFLRLELPEIDGRTAFIGNPPYVRHHDLEASTKSLAKTSAQRLGIRLSGLAGLHVLFMLAAARNSKPGDLGSFITAAEWLDVGYGSAIRELIADSMGGVRLDLVDQRAVPFEDAMTTAIIACWQVGYSGALTVRRVVEPERLLSLAGGRSVSRHRLGALHRWSDFFRPSKAPRDGLVPLGSLARVHRGIATGNNAFFILSRSEAVHRGLKDFTRPVVVRASQVISASGEIRAEQLDHVLVHARAGDERSPALARYIDEGQQLGVHERYLCAHRTPWWRVGGSPAPPIIATYMARRPPAFAENPDGAHIVNVFHGIYPHDGDTDIARALVAWLNRNREDLDGGRTYHGGLRKFEPRELEALLVPPAARLL